MTASSAGSWGSGPAVCAGGDESATTVDGPSTAASRRPRPGRALTRDVPQEHWFRFGVAEGPKGATGVRLDGEEAGHPHRARVVAPTKHRRKRRGIGVGVPGMVCRAAYANHVWPYISWKTARKRAGNRGS